MAVDGYLTFNTKIDTEGFDKGTKTVSSKVLDLKNKISSTESQIRRLRAELERTGNAPVKTKVTEGLEKDFAKANEHLRSLGAQADEIIREKTEALGTLYSDNDLEYLLKQDKAWQQLQEKMDQAEAKVERYKKALANANASAPLSKDTAAFQQKEQKLQELEGQLEVYKAKLGEAEQAEEREAAAARTSGANHATARQKLERTISALKMLANGAAKAGRALKTAFSKSVGKLISNISNHFRKANNSTNVLEKSLRRIKNTLIRMFFFRLVHTPIDAIKDGLGEIAKISPVVNKNLSSLKTESTYLKNSFAALAAPLVNLLTPAFAGLMNTMAGVLNQTGQLISVLTGQSGFTQAIRVQQDYAESLDESTKSTKENTKAAKENQKVLAGFDELNVLNVQEEEDSGSTTSSPMFQNMADQTAGLSKTLLDALKNQDFEAVGAMFGEKINAALSKIKWGKIKTTVKKIAGNIAGFLNGFLESADWNLVGKTIANAIGTGLTFAQTLVRKFNFSALGEAIGNLINGFLSPNNAAMLADTISRFFSGILTTMTKAVKTVDWGKVSQTIVSFITHFKLSDISLGVVNLLNGMASALHKMDFKKIGEAFRAGLSKINWKGIWNGVSRLIANALQGLVDFFGLKGISTGKLQKAMQDIYKPVSELYGTLKNTANELLQPLINDFLPAAVDMVGSIVKAVSPVVKSLTPIFKKAIEVISKINKNLAPVVETFGDTIGKVVDSLSPILQPVLNLIGNVVQFLAPAINGILIAVGKITEFLSPINDFVGGIIGMLTGSESSEPTISAKLQEELDHLSNVSDDLSNISSNINGAISAVDENLATTTSDLSYIDDLQSRLDELMEKAVLTDEDMREINTIGDLLSDKLPGFQEAWEDIVGEDGLKKDEFIQNRTEMSKSIDNVIEKLQTQYAVEALQDQIKEVYKQKSEGLAKMAELTGDVKDGEDKLAEAEKKKEEALKNWKVAFEQYYGDTQEISTETYKEIQKSADDAVAEYNTLKSSLDGTKTELLKQYGAVGQADKKMQELNSTIDVVNGKFDKNKDSIQKLRDAYNNGFIDLDTIEKQYGITSDQLFKDTYSLAENSVKGFQEGIDDGWFKLNDMGVSIGQDVYNASKDYLEINSPSKKYIEIGSSTIEGLEKGIENNFPRAINCVKNLASNMVAAMRNGLLKFSTAFDFLPGMVKSQLNTVLDTFESFLNRICSGINATISQINQLNKAYAESGKGGKSYTTFGQISPMRIPKLATGAFIPANYGEFLAVLGDNKREAEVVSPVSAMKQAFLEALAEMGPNTDSGTTEINLHVDGDKLFSWLVSKNNQYKKSHGYSALEGAEI